MLSHFCSFKITTRNIQEIMQSNSIVLFSFKFSESKSITPYYIPQLQECDRCVYPCEKCIIDNGVAIGATVLEVVLTFVAGALLLGVTVLRRQLKEKERNLEKGSKKTENEYKVKAAPKEQNVEYACADEEPYIEMRDHAEKYNVEYINNNKAESEYVYADQLKEDATYGNVTITEEKTENKAEQKNIKDGIYMNKLKKSLTKTEKKVEQKNMKDGIYMNELKKSLTKTEKKVPQKK